MTKEDQILEILQEHTKKFDAFQGQFDSLENKVDTLQGRFDSLESKVDTLQGQFNSLENKVDTLQGRFDSLENKVDILQGRFDSLENKVTNINETVIVPENEFKDKTSALFDVHAMNQEHLERNDNNLEDVQATLEDHSVRLISLEIDSKERINN